MKEFHRALQKCYLCARGRIHIYICLGWVHRAGAPGLGQIYVFCFFLLQFLKSACPDEPETESPDPTPTRSTEEFTMVLARFLACTYTHTHTHCLAVTQEEPNTHTHICVGFGRYVPVGPRSLFLLWLQSCALLGQFIRAELIFPGSGWPCGDVITGI